MKTALVTGANRGIGFEVCRQLALAGFQVILTARNSQKGFAAADQLRSSGLRVEFISCDVTDSRSIDAAAQIFASKYEKLDVLVNNAGGLVDHDVSASQMNDMRVNQIFDLNLFGSWRVTQTFLPFLKRSASARIVNVSSAAGSHSDLNYGMHSYGGSTVAYGISKLALNGLTAKLAAELKDSRILVNSVCPGWTATHPDAAALGARPIEDGARSVVWAALLPDHGPSGGFFRDGKSLDW